MPGSVGRGEDALMARLAALRDVVVHGEGGPRVPHVSAEFAAIAAAVAAAPPTARLVGRLPPIVAAIAALTDAGAEGGGGGTKRGGMARANAAAEHGEAAKGEGGGGLVGPLETLIHWASQPLVAGGDDVKVVLAAGRGMMEAVATVLGSKRRELVGAACVALRRMLMTARTLSAGTKAVGGGSGVPENLPEAVCMAWSRALQHKEADDAVGDTTLVLKVVVEMCQFPDSVASLTRQGALGLALQTSEGLPGRDRRLPLVIDILWYVGQTSLCVLEEQHWGQLFAAFVAVLEDGYRQNSRELRNDIIIVISVLSENVIDSYFLEPFARLLIDLSTGAECGVKNELIASRYHHSLEPTEHQMRILCWHVLGTWCYRDENLRGMILSSGFIGALTMYIDVGCSHLSVVRWTSTQLFALQRVGLHVLCTVAPVASEDIVGRGVHAVLSAYIDEAPSSDLALLAVQCLARLAATPARAALLDDGIGVAIAAMRGAGAADAMLVEGASLLSDVVAGDPKLRRMARDDGALECLATLAQHRSHPLAETPMPVSIAAVDAIAHVVLGDDVSEEIFVKQHDGVACLLTMLPTVGMAERCATLSVLADLLTRCPVARSEFLEWRGSDGRTALQALLQLWQTAGPSHFDGIDAPIGGGRPADIAAFAARNAMHIKIFACVESMGYEGHCELSLMETAVLAEVRTFRAQSIDGMWRAVAEALDAAGIEPTDMDKAALDALQAAAQRRQQTLQEKRAQLAEQENHLREEENDLAGYRMPSEPEHHTMSNMSLTITQAKIRKAEMLRQSFHHSLAKDRWKKGEEALVARPESDATPRREAAIEAQPVASTVQRWGLGQREMTEEEYVVLEALNRLRTNGRFIIPHLKEFIRHVTADCTAIEVPGRPREALIEGPRVLHEAIAAVESMRPIVTLLDVSIGLLYAARDHAADLASRMEISAVGTDGSTAIQRMQRYGTAPSKALQLISVGQRTPLDIITQLLVDDGVVTRVDRRHLLDPDVRMCGVAVASHSIHERVCVILLASDFTELPLTEQRDVHAAIAAQRA